MKDAIASHHAGDGRNGIRLHSASHQEVSTMAAHHRVSAYDARYLVVARDLGVKLVTEDVKLRKAAPRLTQSLAERSAADGAPDAAVRPSTSLATILIDTAPRMSDSCWRRDGQALSCAARPAGAKVPRWTARTARDAPALKVRLAAPPVDGKANAELLRFLADAFGVPLRNVVLLRGETVAAEGRARRAPCAPPGSRRGKRSSGRSRRQVRRAARIARRRASRRARRVDAGGFQCLG